MLTSQPLLVGAGVTDKSRMSKSAKVGVKTKDLMQVPPVTIEEDTTIEEVAEIMWDKNIGSAIVIDEKGKMSGIVTERDIVFAVTKSLVGKQIPASSVMSRTSLVASPNENIATSFDRMIKAGVRHLPVLDKEGSPIGMISMRDALGISEPLLKFILKEAKKRRR
jgi:CBS domain-containing protein